MKTIFNILILLISSTFAGLLALYIFQHKLIYPAPEAQLDISLPDYVSKIDLGLSHSFLLMPKPLNNKLIPLMIFTHGNAELASHWLYEFKPLIENDIAVLIIEYPGYGGSSAKTNLHTINETMLKAFDVASNLSEVDEKKNFAYGRSIGGGAATLLAKQRPLAALCLESTFSSFSKLISEKSLPSFLLSDRYENEQITKELDIPMFVYHGINDKIIPFSHAESLVASGKNVTFYSENCGHNNCPRKWEQLLTFLKQHISD